MSDHIDPFSEHHGDDLRAENLRLRDKAQDAKDALEELKHKGFVAPSTLDEFMRLGQRLSNVRCVKEAKSLGRHLMVLVAQAKGQL